MRHFAPTSFRSRLMPGDSSRVEADDGPRLVMGGGRGQRPHRGDERWPAPGGEPDGTVESGAAEAAPPSALAGAPRYGRPGLVRWSAIKDEGGQRFLSIPDITGWEVRGENRQPLGVVVDIYVVNESGEARFAVIGGGKRMVLAPVAALSVNESQQVVGLSRRFQEVLHGPLAQSA